MSNQIARNTWNNYIPSGLEQRWEQDSGGPWGIGPAVTLLSFGWIESNSGYHLFDNFGGVGNGDFQAVKGGLYQFEWTNVWLRDPGVDSTQFIWFIVIRDGVSEPIRYGLTGQRNLDPGSLAGFVSLNTTALLKLNAGDRVQLYGYNSEGNFIAGSQADAPNESTLRIEKIA